MNKHVEAFCDDVPAIIAYPIRAVALAAFLLFIAGCAIVTAIWGAGRWFLDAVMER